MRRRPRRWRTGPLPVVAAAAVSLGAAEARAATSQQVPAAPQEPPAAEEAESPWTYGARLVGSLFRAESIERTVGVSGFAVYRVSADVDVEVEAAVLRPGTRVGELPEGRLTLLPVRGTVRVRLWRLGELEPYVGGGAGVYFGDFELDAGIADRFRQLGFRVSQQVKTGFGVHGAGGVELRRGRWILGVDAKYVVGTADADAEIVDEVTGFVATDSTSVDLDGLRLALSVRVHL